MTNDLDFDSKSIFNGVETVLKMFIRANHSLNEQDQRNIVGTFEMIEAFDMTREIILSHITPETVEVKNGKPVTINTGKQRRNDKQYIHFWNDVANEVEDALNTHFTRTVKLSTGTKTSTHPMIRQLIKLIILPVIHHIGKSEPIVVLKNTDTTFEGIDSVDVFGQLSNCVADGAVESNLIKIQVARKTLRKMCSTTLPKINRIALIKKAVKKLANDKYGNETTPINQY